MIIVVEFLLLVTGVALMVGSFSAQQNELTKTSCVMGVIAGMVLMIFVQLINR